MMIFKIIDDQYSVQIICKCIQVRAFMRFMFNNKNTST